MAGFGELDRLAAENVELRRLLSEAQRSAAAAADDQRTLEEQLRQAQKMEAIGNLTAGIAHDFNNMLSVIMPTLEVAVGFLPNERKPIMHEASHAARRASELARQLMRFAGRSPSVQRSHHSSHEIVETAARICAPMFGAELNLATVYEDEAVALYCNAGQLEQVLVNLLLNARDAVVAAGPPRGHVTVRASVRSRRAERSVPDLERWVWIQVSDDGVGMTDEVRERVFEPFFTTKALGRGTGLGLATSYAIVRDHQGRIECASRAGFGSTFTIMLPASSPNAAKQHCAEAE